MRIIKLHEVTFKGVFPSKNRYYNADHVMFWVQSDDGERKEISIPNLGNLVECFEWMSDSDCLRHLKKLEPTLVTNADEFKRITNRNDLIKEQAFVNKTARRVFNTRTGIDEYEFDGLTPLPEKTWEATWSFWSLEHATMFKLAMGGSQ